MLLLFSAAVVLRWCHFIIPPPSLLLLLLLVRVISGRCFYPPPCRRCPLVESVGWSWIICLAHVSESRRARAWCAEAACSSCCWSTFLRVFFAREATVEASRAGSRVPFVVRRSRGGGFFRSREAATRRASAAATSDPKTFIFAFGRRLSLADCLFFGTTKSFEPWPMPKVPRHHWPLTTRPLLMSQKDDSRQPSLRATRRRRPSLTDVTHTSMPNTTRWPTTDTEIDATPVPVASSSMQLFSSWIHI